MNKDKLVGMINNALEEITGESMTVVDDHGKVVDSGRVASGHKNAIYKLLYCQPDKVVSQVLSTASKMYTGDTKKHHGNTKLPPVAFWENQVKKLTKTHELIYSPKFPQMKKEVSAEEKQRVIEVCRQFQEKYPSMGMKKDKKNPFAERLKRFRDYAKSDLVGVEESGHKLEGQWIPRTEAIRAGLRFQDPEEWLRGKIGATADFGGAVSSVVC